MPHRDRSDRVRSEKEKIANRERMRREYPKRWREYNRIYKEAHRKEGLERARLYRLDHREQILQRQKEYRETHREDARNKAKNRYHSDIQASREYMRLRKFSFKATIDGKIETSVRNRISKALRGIARQLTALELLGCTILEYRAYIERQFLPGMSWENYNVRTWHIDHIKPIASFDLSDPEQQRICFHFSNTRPLWAEVNMKRKRA